MRLTSFHLEDLQAVQRGDLFLSSAGFEFDGQPVDEATKGRLDTLWVGDFIDADISGPDRPLVLVLTDKGRGQLAREARPREKWDAA